MKDYRPLRKYLEGNGKTVINLTFNNLKDILGFEVDYSIALHLQKNFRCRYKVDNISEKSKSVSFRRIEMRNEDNGTTTITIASLLWW